MSAWVGLDEVRGFPAMQRLGTAYSRWLARARSAPQHDIDKLVAILESGRGAFRSALKVAREVLSHPNRPHRYDTYDLAEVEGYIYHAWALLELTAADAPVAELRAHGNLRRAVYLSLLGLTGRHRQQIVSLGVLADSLFALGCYRAAASAYAYKQVASGPNDRVVRRGKTKLATHDVELPSVTPNLLPDAVSAALGTLDSFLGELGVETTEASHLTKLRRTVQSLSSEMPNGRWPTITG